MRLWILGEFPDAEASLEAARALRERGYRSLDLYTPYPIPAAEQALALRPSPLPILVAASGFGGAGFAYWFQWYCNAVSYPLNVGGRPFQSAPALVIITLVFGILCASLACFFGLWGLTRLPRLHHPVFEVQHFQSASIDRFWLSIDGPEAEIDREEAIADLAALGAQHVTAVEEKA